MRRFLLFLWIVSLVFAACLVSGSESQTQSPKNEYAIALQGFVWDHSTLNALVVTSNNESWWNPSYLSSATRAVGQWNDAIAALRQATPIIRICPTSGFKQQFRMFRYQVLTSTSIGLILH